MSPSYRNVKLEQDILEAASIQAGVLTLILFGSLADGTENSASDLDLAIDVGHRLAADEKMALISALAEKVGRPVDLVDLQAVGEPLLGQIVRHGKRLAGSDTHFAKLLNKHLVDQADYLPIRSRILAERRLAWIGR